MSSRQNREESSNTCADDGEGVQKYVVNLIFFVVVVLISLLVIVMVFMDGGTSSTVNQDAASSLIAERRSNPSWGIDVATSGSGRYHIPFTERWSYWTSTPTYHASTVYSPHLAGRYRSPDGRMWFTFDVGRTEFIRFG